MATKPPLAQLRGKVTKFSGNGRSLGYPTANLKTTTSLRDGVYFGYADLGAYSNHPALIFIGVPTTVGDKLRRIEAHLLDIIDKDYYAQELRLSVSHFHRPNQKFASVDLLIEVIQDDESKARRWFKEQELAR